MYVRCDENNIHHAVGNIGDDELSTVFVELDSNGPQARVTLLNCPFWLLRTW